MLDLKQKQSVNYVIPLWLRDEQIKLAIERKNVGRIAKVYELRGEPCAIAGFGPSLNETWEEIRNFKWVFSCSGAHRFLIDRGIVPNWQVAVDPLPKNTVRLIGPPNQAVEYLIASTCHPDVFDHLEGYNVKLWHVFDTAEEGVRTLPHGEWAITGGCDVGLRTMTIARFFGFTDLHIFGVDGSSPQNNYRHAADHPTKAMPADTVECNGRSFYTTPAMLAAAQQIWHELDMMPDVKATFYGDGLIQEMQKDYVPKPLQYGPTVAFRKPELISAEYRRLNAELHRQNLAYGVGGGRHADTVIKLADVLKTRAVLDYGCGKGLLAKEIPWPIWEYDPAIPGKDQSPRAADLVVCTDVLEHIEPDKLDLVLADLCRCVKQVGFFSIHTGLAQKTLPDGRNTHLIVKDKVWWKKKLEKFFIVGKIFEKGPELEIVVGAKKLKIKQAVAA